MGRHIFISYSHRDKPLMQKVNEYLNRLGIETWVDTKGLRPGTASWVKSIESGIKEAAAFVVLLTPDANESEFVGKEISFAQLHEIDIFPVLAKGANKESLPLHLVSIQYVDIRKSFKQPMNDLIAELQSSLALRDEITVAVQLVQPALNTVLKQDNWIRHSLGELVKFHIPRTLEQGEAQEGEYPYYGHTGIIRYVANFDYEGRYLLVTRVAPFVDATTKFSAYIVEGKFAVSQGVFLLEVDEKVSIEYLRAYIEHQLIAPFIHGGGFQNYVSQSSLAHLVVWLPSMEELQQIDQQFSQIKHVRELMHLQLELLEQLDLSFKQRFFAGADDATSSMD